MVRAWVRVWVRVTVKVLVTGRVCMVLVSV